MAKNKKVKKAKRSRVKAVKKSVETGLSVVTLHGITAVTEVACQTGAWTPSVSVHDNVDIDDVLGTVVFSGVPCVVTASDSGMVSWVRMKSQVNGGFAVCMIEPGTAIV